MLHKKLILVLVSTCIMGTSIQASFFSKMKTLFTKASSFAKTSIGSYQYRGPRLALREMCRLDGCGYPDYYTRVVLLRKADTHNTPTHVLLGVNLGTVIGASATTATAAYLYSKHKKSANTQSKK